MRKPEVGEFYLIFKNKGLQSGNVIEILRIEGNNAFWRTAGSRKKAFKYPWDFVKFPNGAERKLYPLEVEFL